MKLTTSLHTFSHQILEQLNEANTFSLKQIIWQAAQDTLETVDTKAVLNLCRELKIDIIAIKAIHQSDDDSYEKYLQVCSQLKIKFLMIEMPKINHPIEEYAVIKAWLQPIYEQAIRNRVSLVIVPNQDISLYTYLFNKNEFKELSFYYDPVIIYERKSSLTTTYRLLKNHISFFCLGDIDKKQVPKLIGYGETKILDMIDKLIRDKYKGFLVLDQRMNEVIQKKEKYSLFVNMKRKWFGKNTIRDQVIEDTSSIIFPNSTKIENVTNRDVLDNQIKIVKHIFKHLLLK